MKAKALHLGQQWSYGEMFEDLTEFFLFQHLKVKGRWYNYQNTAIHLKQQASQEDH